MIFLVLWAIRRITRLVSVMLHSLWALLRGAGWFLLTTEMPCVLRP